MLMTQSFLATKLTKVADIKCYLHDPFKIKDLGELKCFLGLEIARSAAGIHICKKKFMLDLLKDTGFLTCKPTATPISNDCRLQKEGKLINDSSSYRRLIGKMLYLTITRPDIAYPVQQLSQFLDCPTEEHVFAAYRVLRYIKGSIDHVLFYSSQSICKLTAFTNSHSSFQIQAYLDADWATCPNTRHSITSYCIFLGSS